MSRWKALDHRNIKCVVMENSELQRYEICRDGKQSQRYEMHRDGKH
jgi:hypothetical protein